ncbi:MAG: RNA-binding S4 domain-containing protein [Crocinitomicaceae bacterium]
MSNKRTFELRAESEYIELMKLLKAEQIAQTGGHAKLLIEEGAIKVNDTVEYQKRKKLRSGDSVSFEDIQIQIL